MIFSPSAILNYIEVFIAIETISIIHDHAKKNTCFHDKSTLYLIGEAVDLSFRILYQINFITSVIKLYYSCGGE